MHPLVVSLSLHIRLYLETFLKHDLPRKERLKYIDTMLTDVTRLSATIGSILDLAGIESKTYAGEFIDVENSFGECIDVENNFGKFIKISCHMITYYNHFIETKFLIFDLDLEIQ